MGKEYIINLISENTSQDSRVLDIGSGRGQIAIEIALRTGCTVYGVDSSRFAVRRAENASKAKGIQRRVIFKKQRAENLDFPSDHFDIVYSVKTLHETSAAKALREMHRVLRKGGKLIIVDWLKGSMRWTFESYFSQRELEALIIEAGFRLTDSEVINGTLLILATKNKKHPHSANRVAKLNSHTKKKFNDLCETTLSTPQIFIST